MILFKWTNEILPNKFYKFKAYNLKNGKTKRTKKLRLKTENQQNSN